MRSPSSTITVVWADRAFNCSTARASSTGVATTMAPTLVRPRVPLASAAISSRVRSKPASTERAKRTMLTPAAVGSVPRVERSNSVMSSMRSISARVLETAGWVTARNSAARPRWRNWSSATSSCRWRSLRLERSTRSILLMGSS